MIGQLLIVCGIVAGALGLLDIFLSDKHKKRIQHLSLVAWNRLHEASRLKLLVLFLQSRKKFWITIAALVMLIVSLGIGALFIGKPVLKYWTIWVPMVAIVVVGGGVGRMMLLHILSCRGAFSLLIGLGYVALLAGCLVLVSAVVHSYWPELLKLTKENYPGGHVIALFGFVIYTNTYLLIFALIAVVPLLVLYVLEMCLLLSEVVVRRIAESPRGMVMATSGLLTSVGGILKFLT
jgi:hypothetical protein